MPISKNERNKRNLAKAVKRKEKAKRLKYNRSRIKKPLNTDQFAKEFVSEALDLFKQKEGLKKELKEKIASIRVLKDTDPTKYSFLSVDTFDELLNSFAPLDASVSELSAVAAKLEDCSTTSEKMEILISSATTLADAQSEMMKFFDKYAAATNTIMGQVKEAKEGVENTNTEPDAIFEDEERTHEDQEIDVSEEDIQSV